jgi:uncharacterized membrane protein
MLKTTMNRFRTFFRTTTLGGLVVVLPAFLLFLIVRWLFLWVTDLIQPLTDVVVAWLGAPEFAADGIVILVIIASCFALGVVVKTSVGRFIHHNLETHILDVAPGYRIIKETVMQLLGRKRSPFSSVALVRIYEREGLMTAFVTDEHESGWKTVFIPTGPNPTTGYIVHLPERDVFPIQVRVEDAIRSVISCGAGSAPLIGAHLRNRRDRIRPPVSPPGGTD